MLQEIVEQTVCPDEAQRLVPMQPLAETEDGEEGNDGLRKEIPEVTVPTVETHALMDEQQVYCPQGEKYCPQGDSPLGGIYHSEEFIFMPLGEDTQTNIEIGEECHIDIPKVVATRNKQIDYQADKWKSIDRFLARTKAHEPEQREQF